jgi:hypothetical protein
MSNEGAIKTEDEIVIDESNPPPGDDEIKADGGAEEVEIVVEGEEQPSSKPVHKTGLQKRFNKLTGKIAAANTEADTANRRSEMLEEENKLLRLQAQQGKPATRPNENDFDTNKEYLAALDEYDDNRISVIAADRAAKIIQANQVHTDTVNQDEKLRSKISKHYERADALKIANFEELEDKAIDILGNDFSKILMANTEKSHLIMAHLGINTGKAEELSELVKKDPVAALVQAVEVGNTLSTKPKGSTAPDPETTVESGGGVSNWQSKIDRARDNAAKTGDMAKLIELKKQARESGATIR